MKNKTKKYLLLISLFTLLFANNIYAKVSFEEQIGPGLIRQEHLVNYNGENSVINLLKCDLNNPHLNIEVIAGKGKYTQRATVSQMAERTDALAAVNGDFFNMILQGSPNGPSIIDGKIESSPAIYTDQYHLAITEDNTAKIIPFSFEGSITAQNGKSFKIDGLNKSYYWYDPDSQYSHQNRINLYNDFWASKSRGDKKNSEVLINKDGVVEQFIEGKNFDFPVPDTKYILQLDGTALDFYKQNIKIGDKVKLKYNLNPNEKFKFLIGGHALLVENGAVKKYTKDINVLGGYRARTAAGISQDGKTLYIASVEGRTKRSKGLSLNNLSDFMLSVGAKKAVNLDGGGSTTMVLKNLGDFNRTKVINPERNGAERKVVNGIGFYNIAPKIGTIFNTKISGPDTILLGESAEYKLKSAYDENLHPIDISNINYEILNSSDNSILNGNYLLPIEKGEQTLILTIDGEIRGTKKVKIVGAEFIKSLEAKIDKKRVNVGDTINVTTSAILNDGRKVVLSPKVLNYQIEGFNGNFDENGNLLINSMNNLSSANVIVSMEDKTANSKIYDHSVKIINMVIGKKEYKLMDENKKMDISPFIKNSRTLVPVRFIIEAMGGEIGYEEESRTVNINYNGNKLELPIDKKVIILNGEEKAIDTPAIIKDSRTFVPIRFVAETLNMEVSYEDKTKTVTIIEPPLTNKVKGDTKIENTDLPKVEENTNIVPQENTNSTNTNNSKNMDSTTNK